MKRTLLLLVCVLGTTAFAGSAYGGEPAAAEEVVVSEDLAAAEHPATTVAEHPAAESETIPSLRVTIIQRRRPSTRKQLSIRPSTRPTRLTTRLTRRPPGPPG